VVALRRQQLVRVSDAGWSVLSARPWDDVARACLDHWAAQRLPLVVTRQAADPSEGLLALGLPAPLQWQRRRLALRLPLSSVLDVDDFPTADSIVDLLPAPMHRAWLGVVGTLVDLGAAPRVHGSFGWQRLTGLHYLHAGSDIDLCLSASGAATADAIVAVLQRAPFATPRLDGELVFPDGSAVAWREWLQWRARRVDRILVKRLHGVAMEAEDAWLGECLPC